MGIAVIDGEGHFLHCNQKLAQITGRGVAELIGIECSEITHPDDWPASQALMEDLRGGIRTEFSAEKRYLRPDGAVVGQRGRLPLRLMAASIASLRREKILPPASGLKGGSGTGAPAATVLERCRLAYIDRNGLITTTTIKQS